MKHLILYAFILMIVITIFSCMGVQYSSGIGIGISGGPYGPRVNPRVNVGVYGGGYR